MNKLSILTQRWLLNRRHFLRGLSATVALLLVGSAGLCAAAAGGEIYLDNATLDTWEPVRPQGAAWTAADGAWLASGPGDSRWRSLIGDQLRGEVALSVKFRVTKPNQKGGYYDGPAFCRYASGEHDGGYDAAAIVRYGGPTAFYRFQVSTAYGELALWKPSGGFLQVKPFPFKPNETYELRVEASGQRLQAFVNGNLLVEYWDRVAPVAEGRVGVGVYNSQARFEAIRLELPQPAGDAPPRSASRFAVKPWRGMDWIFDGDEPVAHLDKKRLVLWDAKLRPGCRPMCYWELHWKQYDGEHNYANQLDQLTVQEQGGPKLRAGWAAQNPAKLFTSRSTLALTYDAGRDSYLYDVATEMEVNAGKEWKNTADGLEYCNLIPYNVVGPAATVREPWPWEYRWILFRGEDGALWRHPIHHNGIGFMHPKPDGGFYAYCPADAHAPAPVVEFDNPTAAALRGYAGLCNWAYDIHFRYLPYAARQVIPSGTKHAARYRVLAYDADKIKQLKDSSRLARDFETDRSFPVFVPGVNDFRLGRRYAEPHAEWAWEGGAWDKSVGRGDTFSLRLDRTQPGVSQSLCTSGSSHFMDGYEDAVYECSAWVKTKDVAGKGATIFVSTSDGKEPKTVHCPQRLVGAQDWTQLSFRPDNVRARTYQVRIGLELDGAGTAWFDDIELKRVGELPKKP